MNGNEEEAHEGRREEGEVGNKEQSVTNEHQEKYINNTHIHSHVPEKADRMDIWSVVD